MSHHNYRILLLWCGWDAVGSGRVGRYQTDTWHASRAMSGHGRRMCSVTAAHTPPGPVDRWRCSSLGKAVGVHSDGQHVSSLRRSKVLAFGV